MIIEVWQNDDETQIAAFPSTVSDKDRMVHLDPACSWRKLREIEGIDWDDCMTQHNQLMGWEPYVPF